MTPEGILVATALLLLVSILASKASTYLGIPALLLFLLVGMLAGSEGLGGIYFDDPALAQFLGVVALTFILFSGGVDTRLADVRPVLGQGVILATLGVLITALAVGGFAMLVLGFSFPEGVLLGAIVSSTDAAAVFSVLRGRNLGLKRGLQPLLEMESGSNDPMAIFLTIGMIHLLTTPGASPLVLVPIFVQQMAIGAGIGAGMGWLIPRRINRLRLEYEGLYPVLTVALVLLTYGATAALGGNGFLAVYLAGVLTGQRDFVHKASLRRFHEGLAWLMQIIMFLTLGLLVFPSRIVPVIGEGLLIALFLMLVARPLSVFLALSWTPLRRAEKGFIAWVGLRGAAPIIMATFPLLAGLPEADTIFNLVFFIVLTSVLVQGTTLGVAARRFQVDAPAERKRTVPLEFVPDEGIQSELVELVVPVGAAVIGQPLVQVGLPEGVLIVLLGRQDEYIVPSGSTLLAAEDVLLLLAEPAQLDQVRQLIAAPA